MVRRRKKRRKEENQNESRRERKRQESWRTDCWKRRERTGTWRGRKGKDGRWIEENAGRSDRQRTMNKEASKLETKEWTLYLVVQRRTCIEFWISRWCVIISHAIGNNGFIRRKVLNGGKGIEMTTSSQFICKSPNWNKSKEHDHTGQKGAERRTIKGAGKERSRLKTKDETMNEAMLKIDSRKRSSPSVVSGANAKCNELAAARRGKTVSGKLGTYRMVPFVLAGSWPGRENWAGKRTQTGIKGELLCLAKSWEKLTFSSPSIRSNVLDPYRCKENKVLEKEQAKEEHDTYKSRLQRRSQGKRARSMCSQENEAKTEKKEDNRIEEHAGNCHQNRIGPSITSSSTKCSATNPRKSTAV